VVGVLDELGGVCSFGLEAFLFFGEYFVVDEAFVVEQEQVLLLGLEGLETALVGLGLLACGLDTSGNEVADLLTEAVLLFGRVEDRAVVVGDGSFDGVDLEVAGSARAGVAHATEAAEVFVVGAGLAAVPP
jgi:hypothetical protein